MIEWRYDQFDVIFMLGICMPKLVGLDWDEQTAWEIERKGWYEQAALQLDDGRLIPLSFYDPVRLRQELEADFSRGKRFFAEKNLVIVPQLTEESIVHAVEELITKGFFS